MHITHFCLKALLILITLFVWGIVCVLIFTIAIIFNLISYCIWWPMLVVRATHRYMEYNVPFRHTWASDYHHIWSHHNPENSLRKNIQFFFLEVAKMTFSGIEEDYRKYQHR